MPQNGATPRNNSVGDASLLDVKESVKPGNDNIDMTNFPPSSSSNAASNVEVTKPQRDAILKAEPATPLTPVNDELGVSNGSPLSNTPHKSQLSGVPLQSLPHSERMTTRVSSGAIRHKSVSEILGETPKSSSSQTGGRYNELSASESSTPTLANRLKERKNKKERSKLSTVVFPKNQNVGKTQSLELARRDSGSFVGNPNEENDYLFTLFQAKAHYPPRSMNLSTLLSTAHKTLSTSNHLVDYKEQMDSRTLKRIYQLQNANRWSLRQPQRSAEPLRPGTHWDVVLDHMKWMRTDFREERKWKIAAAKNCADWCAEYVASDVEQRKLLCIRSRVPPVHTAPIDSAPQEFCQSEQADETLSHSHPTPDLIPSTEDDSVSDGFDDVQPDLSNTVAPAAIFSLGSDEFTFQLDKTPAAENLLEELPLYMPVTISPETNLPSFKSPPDTSWCKDLLPVSKYATGKIEFRDEQPPRKRSRYDYDDSDDEADTNVSDIPPEQTNVALFQPENRHIRDRIHPGHSFRPPTEYPMPSIGFFESRLSSQWTYTEDDELRRLVKEYSFNWSLISSCLSSQSRLMSGPDRRTPWECFERWIGLEGLPADMAKTPYFRAYSARLETAQRNILAAQQAAQQQQQQQQAQAQAQAQAQGQGQGQQPNNNSVPQALIRRRTTQPVRVDRKRSSRHLALLDGMRKLSKKRETLLQKQQHGMLMVTRIYMYAYINLLLSFTISIHA